MRESAIVICVPEAEPYVAHWRERFDPSQADGIPAHITVLYPFVTPDRITEEVLTQVSSLAATTEPFAFRLTRIGRFQTPATVYLAPEPMEPFIVMTSNLMRRFPSCLPYGKVESPIPHLTVAQAGEVEHQLVAHDLELQLRQNGSIEAHCIAIVLLIETPTRRWEALREFALGRR